jgi:hypothetical protein
MNCRKLIRHLPTVTVALLCAKGAIGGISGSADIRSQKMPSGNYHYTITITNTGTTTIGTFWFSWIPGADFLPSTPVSHATPANWTALVLPGSPGTSIRWVAGAAGLIPTGGNLAGFSFDSPDSPATLVAAPPGFAADENVTSFFYAGAPLQGPGFQFNPTVHPVCLADLNGDFQVDDADFVFFAAAYNILSCTDPAMPAGCPADLNGDGSVDDSDFVLFAAAYNALVCP